MECGYSRGGSGNPQCNKYVFLGVVCFVMMMMMMMMIGGDISIVIFIL